MDTLLNVAGPNTMTAEDVRTLHLLSSLQLPDLELRTLSPRILSPHGMAAGITLKMRQRSTEF